MSTSANSFQTTEGYAIEGTQKGLPSPIELFKPGFTWQHATNPQSPFFNGDGQWLDPTKRAECSFFADAENAEWASKVLDTTPWLVNNTDSSEKNQQKVNRLLGQMAVLSRAASELSMKRPDDDRLHTLNKSFVDSYRCYYETIRESEDPRTDLDQNVSTLMDNITALGTVFSETPTAFPESSSAPPTSLLAPITPRPPADTNSGGLSSFHPAFDATDKTDSGPRKDTKMTSTSSVHACKSEGSGRLGRLFGKGSGRKGEDREV